MFGIGPIELVIVLALFVGLPVAIVALVMSRKTRDGGPNACPACQGRFAGSAKFCPHCGKPLG